MAGKKNEDITKMYELYCSGKSLEAVGKMFCKTRQSVYGLFKYHGLKTRGKKEELSFVVFNGSKYTKRNNGYFGKTKDKRNLLHRDVWEFYNGKIAEGFDIHHKDGDKENNCIGNLSLYSKSEHTRLFSPHNNQYTKGKKR